LLRCGKPEDFDANPDNRLRLTAGLRKRDGRWVVTTTSTVPVSRLRTDREIR
jgi:hypothetical protein